MHCWRGSNEPQLKLSHFLIDIYTNDLEIMQGLRPEILAGIPDNMYNIVRRIEDSFAISTPDLRKLANHFEEQLQRGMIDYVLSVKQVLNRI